MKNGYRLSPITLADAPTLVKHLNEKEIYLRTLHIPYPYTPTDADFWVKHMAEVYQRNAGAMVTAAIRSPEGEMIGSVGLDGLSVGTSYRAELGYWLAKPYWGQGIVTEAVGEMVKKAFEEWGLVKITSSIFSFNTQSQRVLEKNGFVQEGELKRHFRKDGRLIDAKAFARFPADSDR
jgi:ribosomal-protein-alanine N-acetyltransferase